MPSNGVEKRCGSRSGGEDTLKTVRGMEYGISDLAGEGRHQSESRDDGASRLRMLDTVPENRIWVAFEGIQGPTMSNQKQFAFRARDRNINKQMGMGVGVSAAQHGARQIFREDRIKDYDITGAALELMNRADADLLVQTFVSQHAIEQFHLRAIGRHNGDRGMGACRGEHVLCELDTEEGVIDVVG